MSNVIELNPVDFVTVGTIGPKGQRTFHLQAGKDNRIVSFTIEKEQAQALSAAITEMLDDIDARENTITEANFSQLDMELREPIEPLFRIAQMGLAHDRDRDQIILVATEYVPGDPDKLDDLDELDVDDDDSVADFFNPYAGDEGDPMVARMWCTRQQMRALSLHAMDTVKSGRPDARQNGRIIFYWT
ncbi:MAG: DUF3090 family protein [Chloroflexi bacterium]|nr:DUF3090 family protein [Chloroflexota bacterium]MCY3582299.1 DUF3090 family protein [Chloroflexota bacterium]MCY3716163.1 DUF3090 family protein [Chloroflexota bacterium]MDE2650945.1 DUF3090 family protein [Chloroflexota bacterium]MXX82149.1 DUF3090 family protein [Chloroflexota bacterium]